MYCLLPLKEYMQHIVSARRSTSAFLPQFFAQKAIGWLYVKPNEAQKESHLSFLQTGQQEAIMITRLCIRSTSDVLLGPQDVL